MNFQDPGTVIGKLDSIATDLANRQNSFEKAAKDYYSAKRGYELEWAKERIRQKSELAESKPTKDDLDNKTLIKLATSDAYKKLIIAEAAYEGHQAAVKVLNTRSVIGCAILRAQTNA